MSEEVTRADRILGADWRPPNRVRLERAWAAHPERDLLDELKGERDERGDATWQLVREPSEGDWVEYWMRPVDPRDERLDIRVCRWPESVEARADADAQSVVEEHDV